MDELRVATVTERLETQRIFLAHLFHARRCRQNDCQRQLCSAIKNALVHQKSCMAPVTCTYPQCARCFVFTKHWILCPLDDKCPLCGGLDGLVPPEDAVKRNDQELTRDFYQRFLVFIYHGMVCKGYCDIPLYYCLISRFFFEHMKVCLKRNRSQHDDPTLPYICDHRNLCLMSNISLVHFVRCVDDNCLTCEPVKASKVNIRRSPYVNQCPVSPDILPEL